MSRAWPLAVSVLALALASCPSLPARRGDAPAAAGKSERPAGEKMAGALALSADNTRVSFVGTAGRTSHEGWFSNLSGQLRLPSDDMKDASLKVEIDMTSLSTKNFILTKHLKTDDFFNVEKYPQATFVSSQIEPKPDGESTHLITGDFTIHGVKKTLSFPARFTVTPEAVTLKGTFTVRQSEFGMETGAKKTSDAVPVTVSATIPRR
jgi:polyisoprenoid-binding protein YceI